MRRHRSNVVYDEEDLESDLSSSSTDSDSDGDDDDFKDVISGGVQRAMDTKSNTTKNIATTNPKQASTNKSKPWQKEEDIVDQINRLSLGPPTQTAPDTHKPKGIFAKLQGRQNPLVRPQPHKIPASQPASHSASNPTSLPAAAKSQSLSSPAKSSNQASTTFGSPVKSFNASNGSFLEPMTPSSRKWGQKFDISKFREEVPINVMTSKMVEAKKRPQSVYQPPAMPVNGGSSDPTQAVEEFKRTIENIDYLEDKYMGTEDVPGLEVKLLEHQIRGLAFLKSREASGVTAKGGLLCDDMGLGKTIQSISLILSNRASKKWLAGGENRKKATLVVAPLALIAQWQDEVHKKTGNRLKALVHHGAKRTWDCEDFDRYDVIITTYQTLNSDVKAMAKEQDGPCLQAEWWRIILDEAHTIKNRNALMTKATLKLKGDRKWCLTGTPIQNNINDIYPLIAFIGIKPYNDYATFTGQMDHTPIGRRRLRVFLPKIMVRRSKEVLGETKFKMPEKRSHLVRVELTEQERAEYESFETKTKDKLQDSGLTGGRSYMLALVLLLRLRQICCHWKLVHSKLKEDDMQALDTGESRQKSPRLYQDDSSDDELADSLNRLKLDNPGLGQLEQSLLKDVGAEEWDQVQADTHSSKMIKAIEIIKSEPKRKTILFSQFTSMLDLLEPQVEQMGIKYVRYDGSMRPQSREESLRALREDDNVTLLLCSLKCGALGLNLTVASRVILFDPWWNPMIMDQAVDRVHRIGQNKVVDVYQMMVVQSVEERIYALQDAKRELANSVLAKNDPAKGKGINTLDRDALMALLDL